MGTDARAPADFYATARGGVAARLLRARLIQLRPDLTGQRVLGLCYTTPYMRLLREKAQRCIAATPAQNGISRRHHDSVLSFAVDEDALPFADLSLDRILLVHGLENAENARRMLREVWRVLKDDGRLLVVAPNRVGMWAHVENTPFGQGQPYSPGQIERLLAASLFRVERRDTALYLPPSSLRLVLRSARLFEQGGRGVVPHLAGVTITEAVKDVYAALPLCRTRKQRRLVLSELS